MTCVVCGSAELRRSHLICWRCEAQEPGKFVWPRVVCRTCGKDVAITPRGWTVPHRTQGQERTDRYGRDITPTCKRYRVQTGDPTLRAPRQIGINPQEILSARRVARQDEYPELI